MPSHHTALRPVFPSMFGIRRSSVFIHQDAWHFRSTRRPACALAQAISRHKPIVVVIDVIRFHGRGSRCTHQLVNSVFDLAQIRCATENLFRTYRRRRLQDVESFAAPERRAFFVCRPSLVGQRDRLRTVQRQHYVNRVTQWALSCRCGARRLRPVSAWCIKCLLSRQPRWSRYCCPSSIAPTSDAQPPEAIAAMAASHQRDSRRTGIPAPAIISASVAVSKRASLRRKKSL